MEYLSPSRRLRILKKKFTIEQERGKRPAFSQSHRPPRALSFRPTPWNTKRRTVVLNRVCIWEIFNFCPKQSQGFKHSAAYLYPNIGLVPLLGSPNPNPSLYPNIGRVPPLGSPNPNPSLYPNIGRVTPFPGSRSLYEYAKAHVPRLCLH